MKRHLPLLSLGLCLACSDAIEPARALQGEVASDARVDTLLALDAEGAERGAAAVDDAGRFTLLLPLGGPYELHLYEDGTWVGTLSSTPQICAEGALIQLGLTPSCSADCVRTLGSCEARCEPELPGCPCEARFSDEDCVEACQDCSPRGRGCDPQLLQFGCEGDS